MANPLSAKLVKGTIGELLVQLRLLQFGVQAAAPIKDTGNDLIAVRGYQFRAIQVKTTAGDRYRISNLPRRYHLLAVVRLVGADNNLHLDESEVFLIPKRDVASAPRQIDQLDDYAISAARIRDWFSARR